MSTSIKTQYFWGTEWRNEQGQRHREDGPAIDYEDDEKEWYINGKRHRLVGPAVIWEAYKSWWVNDHCVKIY
jgi:hypothetical protein